MQYWKDKTFERFVELIQTDLHDKWDNIKPFVRFRTIKNLLVTEKDTEDEEKNARADVIYCPMFFREDITLSLDKLPSHLKKSINRPNYLLCVFTD
jgi:hypothetical protein